MSRRYPYSSDDCHALKVVAIFFEYTWESTTFALVEMILLFLSEIRASYKVPLILHVLRTFKLQPRIMNYVTLDRGLHSNCANYVDSCASFGRKRNVTPWVIALLIVLIILIFWSRLQMMSLYKRKQLMHLLETAVVKRLVAKIPTSFYWWLCIYYGKATKIDINCYHAQLGSFVAL